MKSKKTIIFIVQAGIIAAVYVVLTYISALVGLASGVIQVRISEALCILPLFTPAAIPGLFIGCAMANLLTGCLPLDILFGALATLLGALGAYIIGRGAKKYNDKHKSFVLKLLIPIPNLFTNMVIVPWVLRLVYGETDAIWFLTLTVGAGELIAGVGLGLILLFALEKRASHIFRLTAK
ncbi:MAG: QueT transporter family protein [Clostridiales bacterium]|nr:QueT transporter family protein [Clostridiales bacterium]